MPLFNVFALTYTAPEVIAILAAAGGFVITIASQLGNLIIAWRTSQKVSENTDVTKAGIAKLGAQAEVINGHVNSKASASDAKIDALQQQLELMRSMLAEKQQTAAVLAAAVAHPPQVQAQTAAPAVPDPAVQEMATTVQEIHSAVTERRVREADKDRDHKS